MVYWHYCRANMSDMAPWQNKAASCWHLGKKVFHSTEIKYLETVINWNVFLKKTCEMSFCALVGVECFMALYNKGRQTVLLLISTSTNGSPAWSKSESKAKDLTQTFLNHLSPVNHMSLYIARWTSVPVRTLWSQWKRRLQCVTGYGGIEMTERRRPFALTPDSRHPVCARTFPHIRTFTMHTIRTTHSSWATHSCSHVVLHADIYAHTG